MKKEELQAFCERYFMNVGATIVLSVPGYFEAELPTEIDKELTDRPFYWMWIEATGQTPPTTVLRLKFEPSIEPPPQSTAEGKVELVALGSFRLNKIFESIATRGRVSRQYQVNRPSAVPLEPWLLVPYKVSFIADRRRDEIRSAAIHLISGEIVSDFYPIAARAELAPIKPAGFVKEPTQDALTAWNKLKHYIAEQLEQEDCTWAFEAGARLQEELEQLETYYESLLLDSSDDKEILERDKQVRIQELKWRTQPKIQVEPIFMAILYFDPHWLETQHCASAVLA